MEFHFPQHVHLGQGASQKFGLTAKGLGARVLLLVDEAFEGSQPLSILTHSLERAAVPSLIHARGARQGFSEAFLEAVHLAQGGRVDVVAALGSGDQLSLGRAVVSELALSRPLPYLEVPSDVCYPLLLRPEVFVPGHPAELKFSPFVPPGPHHVFLDPHAASGTTKALASSHLEALFYATEAFLHEGSSVTARSLLAGAIEVLWSTVKTLNHDPAHGEARLATTQAGFNVALACALGPRGTALTLAHTLAGLADLPGTALGSLFLAPLIEDVGGWNRWEALGRAFGVTVGSGDEASLGPRIAQEVRKVLNTHRLPLRLTDYRLVESQLNQAVDVVRSLDLGRGGVLDGDHLGAFLQRLR